MRKIFEGLPSTHPAFLIATFVIIVVSSEEQAEDLAFLAFLAPAEEARFFFGILGWGCAGGAVAELGTAEVEQLKQTARRTAEPGQGRWTSTRNPGLIRSVRLSA